ncbi:IS3 family transposase [Caproiciproducens galactitolivorans]|uniref:IS3 family transposase n=1 Tax=Caproiciproducens galactitolivorans TaxID=642589 RepID=UPI0010834201|nr:IS3 family transposase [Caproiciproducens galactitolivorans]
MPTGIYLFLKAGHEKYRTKFSSCAEVEQAVAEYVQFYNYERINMKNGLTPSEIRSKTA